MEEKLQTIQNKKRFFAELDEREKAWEKNGKSTSLEELERHTQKDVYE
jgi:hypothetical protein